MVRLYDRPLLRSSARGDGAVDRMLDRFEVRNLATSMRACGSYLLKSLHTPQSSAIVIYSWQVRSYDWLNIQP